MDNKLIITINREYGSGGRLVGQRLSEELGIPLYDRKLIEMAAQESGLSPDFIENVETRPTSSFLFNLATSAQTGSGYMLQYDMPVGDRAFFAQSNVIRDLAAKESCVIVGRCAGYILRENPSCLNVFVYGSVEDRLNRATSVYGVPRKDLADRLVKIDKGRANYFKYYTGEDWYDVRAYDLAINTAVSGVEGAVKAVTYMSKHLVKTKPYRD